MARSSPRPRLAPAPVRWLGGKGKLVHRILPYLPPHERYVEPFGGGAAVLLAKAPAPLEVYNDLDEGLVSFFRVLRDPAQTRALIRRVLWTPYARAEWRACREAWASGPDPVERAAQWYVTMRMSFGGDFGHSWGRVTSTSRGGMVKTVRDWQSGVKALRAAGRRLRRIQIEQADWRQVLTDYDAPPTLWYLDPPYLLETRRTGAYRHELTAADHEDLVARAQALQGMVLLSGYASALYAPLDAAGWDRVEFRTSCFLAGRTPETALNRPGAVTAHQPRLECLWRNPRAVQALVQAHQDQTQEEG